MSKKGSSQKYPLINAYKQMLTSITVVTDYSITKTNITLSVEIQNFKTSNLGHV